jgi:type I restriction enzyme R subunit
MQGVGLMQAIARVNRRFRDKPGGLIIDYIGIAHDLRTALANYSPSDRDQAGVPIDEVIAILLEKHDIITAMLHGVPWTSSPTLSAADRLNELKRVMDFVLADPDLRTRFTDQTLALLKAFALAGGSDATMAIRDDVQFFAGVRAQLIKLEKEGTPGSGGQGGTDETDTAIAQLVSQAVAADEIIDIYAAAGMDRPDLSILSDEFLEGMQASESPNLQMQLLRKLLNDEIRTVRRRNVVQARQFSVMLDAAIAKYTNRNLTTAEVIAELVALAKAMRGEQDRAAELGLTDAEVAFYDAVVQNDAAILELGDDTLKMLARKLVDAVRESAAIDWNLKESVRAEMKAKIRRLLTRYDYPPGKEEQAIQLVLAQAEVYATSEVG